MKRIYYKDAHGNPWVLVNNNGNRILAKVTPMDSLILTKNKEIVFRMNVLKRVRNKPDMPVVVSTVFTTESGNKYVRTTVGNTKFCFVMDSKDNVLKSVNEKEFEDTYEKCHLANFKTVDICLSKVIDSAFKRKEHMANTTNVATIAAEATDVAA